MEARALSCYSAKQAVEVSKQALRNAISGIGNLQTRDITQRIAHKGRRHYRLTRPDLIRPDRLALTWLALTWLALTWPALARPDLT